jgi:hypothetical protein
MTKSVDFDAAFSELLNAFSRHQDLRKCGAPLSELSDSASRHHRAQMRTYRALHPREG